MKNDVALNVEDKFLLLNFLVSTFFWSFNVTKYIWVTDSASCFKLVNYK